MGPRQRRGYLDKDTLGVVWTDRYLGNWCDNPERAAEYVIVIPTRLIENVHLFNPVIDGKGTPESSERFVL